MVTPIRPKNRIYIDDPGGPDVRQPKPKSRSQLEREHLERAQDQAMDRLRKHLAIGKDRGRDLFGGGLDLQELNRDSLMMLRQQAEGGFAAPQLASIKSNALAGLRGQQAARMRDLQIAQGASGIRGAAAQAGHLRALQQGDIARRGLEADFADRDIGIRLQGLQDLRSAIGNERFGQLATEFGYAGLGTMVDNNTLKYLSALKQKREASEGLYGASSQGPSKSKNEIEKTGTKIAKVNPLKKDSYFGKAGNEVAKLNPLKKDNAYGGIF